MQIGTGLYSDTEDTASNQQLYFIAWSRWWRSQRFPRKDNV